MPLGTTTGSSIRRILKVKIKKDLWLFH